MKAMEIILEKTIEPESILFFQEGMRGSSVMQENVFYARFIWKDDKWWHVLNDPLRFQPVWIRVRMASLKNWTPDLLDPATAGIILDRISNLSNTNARFLGNELILEDGRAWSGVSRHKSLELYLKSFLS
jgi:hypothetical protein